MPHLRFSRDKRGYENTFVVHSARRHGKVQRQILYWFRTPPNVRVGRAALDEDAIRTIEESNPDLRFDWSRILASRPEPSPPAEDARDRRRRGRRPAPDAPAKPARRSRQQARRPAPSRPAPVELPLAAATPDDAEEAAAVAARFGTASPPEADDVAIDEAAMDAEPAQVPVTVYYGGADVLVRDAASGGPRLPPVEARLGTEALARLRARYAEILARIAERTGVDPARLEELRREAERLNPDSWVTEAEIAAGLQQFDARLGAIRRALGVKRRRRSRRGGRRRRGGAAAGTAGAGEASAADGSDAEGDTDPGTDEAEAGDAPEDEDDDRPV